MGLRNLQGKRPPSTPCFSPPPKRAKCPTSSVPGLPSNRQEPSSLHPPGGFFSHWPVGASRPPTPPPTENSLKIFRQESDLLLCPHRCTPFDLSAELAKPAPSHPMTLTTTFPVETACLVERFLESFFELQLPDPKTPVSIFSALTSLPPSLA